MARGIDVVRKYDLSKEELDAKVQEAFAELPAENMEQRYEDSVREFEEETILKGKVLNVVNDEVIVDIGYKSEGVIPLAEFGENADVDIGDEIEVLLDEIEDETGMIRLSKRKADRIRAWNEILKTHNEGDVVRGVVQRKIKGGLLVDVGVPVFLPASQVSLRRTADISEFIGQEIEARIIKIDVQRMNIVVSRRKLVEEQREAAKKKLLEEIQEGEIRRGVVKNIADFGAFVDLGGIDGLLHITDMSWTRINHPSEVVSIDQEIEVMVLRVDREKERIALGLKQRMPSPWEEVELRYPVGSKVKGKVVNVMSYGAFVQLENGLEGLVHVSEMSWTRRVNHPSEVVKVGDEVEVVILEIDKDKQEIGLGMKQAEVNPWDLVEEKYPPGTIVEGQVRNLTNYGAFVALEEGIDGLLHISDMSWTKKVTHPSEMLTEGDQVKAIVLSVDRDKKRVSLGLKQLAEDPWKTQIADRYKVGDVVVGTVTKITNFGVFVELEENLEGLLHVSELSTRKIHSPEEVVQVGDQVEVTVLKVDAEERKIGLSLIASDDGGGPKIVRRGGGAEKAAAATEPAPETPAEPEAVAEAPEAVAEEPAPAEAEEAPVADPEPVAEPAAEEETAVEPEAEPAAETAEEPAPESEPVAEPATGEETAVEPEAEPAVETAKEPAVAPEPEPAAEAEDKPAEEEAGEEAEKA
ncbi:MAG: 30S ribosomal protein S1 [Planctomycetota bacterium]|jgi:small subunit ribosomal protein S1